MKLSISAAKYVGFVLLKYIISTGTKIEFVTTIEGDTYQRKIVDLCIESNIAVYTTLDINTPEFRTLLVGNKIDLHFMLWFPTIVQKDSIESVSTGFVNIHPSLLPYNRGMHPWYWSIVEKTGVTTFFIDEKIDNGSIIAQREVQTLQTDTGESMYKKLLETSISLFYDTFESILDNSYNIIEPQAYGTFHLSKDIESSSNIQLEEKYTAEQLINILRARTFTDGIGAFFYKDGKKYNIKLNIYED